MFVLDVKASNLKKGFFGKPKPSVRINIVPRVRHLAAFQKHHGLQGKASSVNNTVDPRWENEVSGLFTFICIDVEGEL